MNREEIRNYLSAQVKNSSSYRVAARLGISQPYLWMLIHGQRNPGPKILEVLGLEPVVSYRRRDRNGENSNDDRRDNRETQPGIKIRKQLPGALPSA